MSNVLLQHRLQTALSNREASGLLRKLPKSIGGVDFMSNDYLGYAREFGLINSSLPMGSGGARLLSGDAEIYHVAEQKIANFHNEEAALLFPNGYLANLALLSTLPSRGDTILYDALVHASIREGIRLSNAKSFSFRHNDLIHLEERLLKAEGVVFVVTESIFSMDGDQPDLLGLVELAKKYEFNLLIDEAHAGGVFNHGKGLVEGAIQADTCARTITFGKAFGRHGAAVIGSKLLIDYLINFARPFIYSTAMPQRFACDIAHVYDRMNTDGRERQQALFDIIDCYNSLAKEVAWLSKNNAPIQFARVVGNKNAKKVEHQLQKSSFAIKAILSPTVPKGSERIRICLHAFNSQHEVESLISELKKEING